MTRIILIAVISIIFSSCFSKKNISDEAMGEYTVAKSLSINPEESRTVFFDSLYSDIEFVPLETRDGQLIDNIHKVLVFKDKFYVMCNKSIKLFDKNGRFISEINKLGKGPNEYQSLSDFYINADGSIEILDRVSRKILCFDSTANWIGNWDHGISAQSFFKSDSINYIFYCGNIFNGEEGKKLIFKNRRDNKIQAQFFNINSQQAKYLHLVDMINFYPYNDTIRFVYSSNNAIFSIIGQHVVNKTPLDFGEANMAESFLTKDYENIAVFLEQFRKEKYAFVFDAFFETKDLLFFYFLWGDKTFHAYYSKKDNSVIVADQVIYNYENFQIKIPVTYDHTPRGIHANRLIFVVEPTEILEQMNFLKKEKAMDEIKTMEALKVPAAFKNLSVGDNPILLLAKLK